MLFLSIIGTQNEQTLFGNYAQLSLNYWFLLAKKVRIITFCVRHKVFVSWVDEVSSRILLASVQSITGGINFHSSVKQQFIFTIVRI